jgi:hypothetical protein
MGRDMKTPNQLCVEAHAYAIEACALGDEAIRIAIKANALSYEDMRRWKLWSRMLEINHRLKEISETVAITEESSHENRTV